MQLLDGKALSLQIKEELAIETTEFKNKTGKTPHLAAILVGTDGASQTYVASKVKDCEMVGFKSSLFRYDDTLSEKDLLDKIESLNADDDVDGILVQLPLPKHIAVDKVTQAIDPAKDVDGFHPANVGKLSMGLPTFISATPLGILLMLEKKGIETEGKHCVVMGRSNIVGYPMSILMARKGNPGNCTVTMVHSRTKNMKEITLQADILIVAIGKYEFVTKDMVKPGAVVIDVGITRVPDETAKRGYRLKGDVKFDEVSENCSFITPVPGGVGPMTRVGLLYNTLLAAKRN